jgi:hypothetical protein
MRDARRLRSLCLVLVLLMLMRWNRTPCTWIHSCNTIVCDVVVGPGVPSGIFPESRSCVRPALVAMSSFGWASLIRRLLWLIRHISALIAQIGPQWQQKKSPRPDSRK